MAYSHPKSNKGFTLIEVLAAIFILSIGILGLAYAFPPGIQTAKNTEKAAQAVTLAQAKIEEMLSYSYDSDELVVNPDEPNEPRHKLSDDPADPLYYFERETNITFVDPDPAEDLPEVSEDLGAKKIVVDVFWQMPFSLGDRSIELITLVSKR